MEKIVRTIDTVNDSVGKAVAWLAVPLTIVVLIEVSMRYFANQPTIWVYDVSWMLFSVFFLLGGGFTMVRKKHVRIDLLLSVFSEKGQAIYELCFFLIMFLPVVGVLGLRSIEYAGRTWESGQSLSTTVWSFPAAPIRTVVPIAFGLLFLQGIAEVLRNVLVITNHPGKGETE